MTFLFADLVGSSALSEQLDAETFHHLIDQWLQAMTEEVERFGGMLNQFSGDGILALFGAPLAQEDAPVQACRAALSLQRRLGRLETARPLSMRIGVDSGEIVAGLVGTDRRNEYAALGQRTNRAKRVQEQADPGSILISGDTYDLVREYFRLLPSGEFLAKGFTEPVTGYRLLDEKGHGEVPRLAATMARWHSPLVGRDAELAKLEEALAAAAVGCAQHVTIDGAAGVGKSRLLHEIALRARGRGFAVHEGRSKEMRAHVPYAPYADVVRSICEIRQGDLAATSEATLQAKAGEGFPYLYELLNPSAQLSPLSDPNARMLATSSAVERIIRDQAAQQPLLLILDDAHWSDPLSQALTESLLQHCEGATLVICTARRSETDLTTKTTALIHLEPLQGNDIAELVSSLNGLSGDEARRLVAWLERQSGGLPLFIEELLVALQSRGSLRNTGSQWELAQEFEQEHLPASVQDLIAARIDRLAQQELHILQLASVAGDELLLAEVEALAADRIGITTCLSKLEQAGLLKRGPKRDALCFASALARRVVYRTIPRAERETLHRRLAEYLEGVDSVEDPLLAHHFHQGGDTPRAIALLRRAAARAEWAFANTDAAALLTQVLNLGGAALSDTDRIEALIQRGRLRTTFLGDTSGLSDLDGAIALSSASDDAALCSRAVLAKGVALCRQFRFAESLEWLQRAENTARSAGAVELQIEALLQRAFVLSENQISGAGVAAESSTRDCCEEALALSRQHHNATLEVQALHSLGTACLQELDYDRALEVFQRCIEQAQGTGDRATESLALQSLARAHQFRFDFEAAIAATQRLQVLLKELGDRRRLAFSTFNLAAAYLGSGQADTARQTAEAALIEANRLGLDYLQKLTLRLLMGLSSGSELIARRIELCEQLRGLLTNDNERCDRSDILIELANAYVDTAAPERASACLSESAKLDIDLGNFSRAQGSLQRLQELAGAAH